MRPTPFRDRYRKIATKRFLKKGMAAWIAATAMALACRPDTANASVVNVQLNTTAGSYSGQGALVTADAHIWNNIFLGPPPTLVDSTGASTTVTLSVTRSFLYSPGSTLDTGNDLLDGVYDASPGTFTIGGLSTTTTYDLYLYGWSKEGSPSSPTTFGGTFNITSGAGSNTNPLSTTGAALASGTGYTSSTISTSDAGIAYVEYTGLIPNSSGQITGTYNTITNGFQLVTAGTAPEPATLSLLSVAAIGLLSRRRA